MVIKKNFSINKHNYYKGVSKLFSWDLFLKNFYLNKEDEDIDRLETIIDWYIVGKEIELSLDIFKNISNKEGKFDERRRKIHFN